MSDQPRRHIRFIGAPDQRLVAAVAAHGLTCSFASEAPEEPLTLELTAKTIDRLKDLNIFPDPKQPAHWYEPCLKRRRKR